MQNPITKPRAFFDQIVVPDCQEAIAAPEDVRKVLHACMSLYHLRDWLSNAGLISDSQEYNTSLHQRCPELKTIRAVAINSKHPSPKTAPVMTVGVSAAQVGWGVSWGTTWQGWIQGEQEQVLAKTGDGQSYWTRPSLLKAFNFWKKEFEDNKW